MKHIRQYKSKSGKMQFQPSMAYLMALGEDSGFCLACGADADGVEPDARQYECCSCGEYKVYGREEIIMMGLSW